MILFQELSCCGCGRWVVVSPFVTVRSVVNLTGAACRHCYRRAPEPMRIALRSARLDMRLHDGPAQMVLLFRAWEAVRLAIEERDARSAA